MNLNKNINYYITSNLPNPLTKKETQECFEKYLLGDESAREKLIIHNIRLVNFVAKKYDYDLDDLIQIGIFGLFKAIDKFDYKKKIEFSTFAFKCIENEILLFFRKNSHLKREISYDNYIYFNDLLEKDDLKYIDTIEDESANFEEDIENKIIESYINEEINKLPDKIKMIFKLYFGFDNNIAHSASETSKKLNVSKQYISFILKKYLKIISIKLKRYGIIDTEYNQKNRIRNK